MSTNGQKTLRFLKRFLREKSGASAMMFGLSLPVFVGFLAVGTEAGYWYLSDRQLQNAADMAAYAGAAENRSGSNLAIVRSAATREANRNGYDAANNGSITVNNPPQAGAFIEDAAVEVILRETRPRLLSAIFSSNHIQLTARAVAREGEGSEACILALDRSSSGAVTAIGSTTVELQGCSVHSNSSATDSFILNGAALMTTECVSAVGGVEATDGLTMTECQSAMEHQPLAADPYEDLEVPQVPAGCSSPVNSNPNSNITVSPGRYCGGLQFRGTAHLEPGVYIIDGGTFQTNAQSNISGDGVTIIMTNGASLQMNGGATVELSAPTAGDYAGVVMMADRDDPFQRQKINGKSSSDLQGALYFPTQSVEVLGAANTGNGCTMVVAHQVKLSGDARFGADCGMYNIDYARAPGPLRLVE